MDRGVATNDWLIKFSRTRIHHLSSDSSDHCPLCKVLDGLVVARATNPFRFKEMWLSNPGCFDVVEAVWSSNDNADLLVKIMRKIERCGKELKRWNWDHFGNVRRELAIKGDYWLMPRRKQ